MSLKDEEGQSECAHLLYKGQQFCWQWHQNRQLECEYLPPYLCIQVLTHSCVDRLNRRRQRFYFTADVWRPPSAGLSLRYLKWGLCMTSQAMFRLCLQLARITLIPRPLPLKAVEKNWCWSGSGLRTLSKSSCLGRMNDSIVLSHLIRVLPEGDDILGYLRTLLLDSLYTRIPPYSLVRFPVY